MQFTAEWWKSEGDYADGQTLPAIPVDLVTEFFCFCSRVFRKNNAAGGTNHEPAVRFIQTGFDRGLHVAALGADPGDEKSHFTDEGANFFHFGGVGGADDEQTVLIDVPLLGYFLSDDLPERFASEGEILQFAGARVGSAAEDDGGFVRAVEERLEGLAAQVGMEGDGVETQPVKNRSDVAVVGVADVGALGVANSKDVGMGFLQVVHRQLQLTPAVFAEGFIECHVRFVDSGKLGGLVDNPLVEFEDRLGFFLKTLGELAQFAVEADTNEGVGLGHTVMEFFENHGELSARLGFNREAVNPADEKLLSGHPELNIRKAGTLFMSRGMYHGIHPKTSGRSGSCLRTLALLFLGFCMMVGIAVFFTVRWVHRQVDLYTATSPVALPRSNISDADYPAVLDRVTKFSQALNDGTPTGPLVLNEQELNSYLERAKGKEVGDHVYLILDGSMIKGRVSYPLDSLDWSWVKGRYLNGNVTLDVSLQNGHLMVFAEQVEVNGLQLPESFMQGIRTKNLAEKAMDDPKGAADIAKFKSIQVKDGKVIIEAQTGQPTN